MLATALIAALGTYTVAPAHAGEDAVSYEPTGETVEGGASAGDATMIEAGDWKDTLGVTGTDEGQRWFAVDRTVSGSTLRFTAVLPSGAPESSHQLTVEAFAGSTSCGKDTSTTLAGGNQPIAVAAVVVGPRDPDECMSRDDLTFSVTREVSQSTEEQTAATVEIRVVEEPPADNAEELPTESADTPDDPPSLASPADLAEGASSFGEATALEPGAYKGSITPGETKIYRVDVTWGQSLDTFAQFSPLTAGQTTEIEGADLEASLVTYSPARAVASDSGTTYGRLSEYSTPEVRSTTAFVTYNLRDSSWGPTGAASIAGPYYLVISMPAASGDAGAVTTAFDFTLGVAVHGEESGVPDFGEEEAVIGPDLEGGGFLGTGWLPWALGAAGLLLVVGGVAVFLLARRRPAASSYGQPGQYGQPGRYGQPGPYEQHGSHEQPGPPGPPGRDW